MLRTSWSAVLLKAFLPVLAYSAGAIFNIYPKIGPQALTLIGLLVFLGALFVEYETVVYPAERWENIAPFIADQVTNDFSDFVRLRVHIQPRMNVMLPVRFGRYLWFRKFFCIWWSRGMDNQPDVNVTIPAGYGLVSECFDRKEPVIAALKVVQQNHKLPKELQRLVADLDVIISVPIYEARSGSSVQSGRLLGVFNLDSKTPGAFDIFKNDPTLLLEVKRRMEEIASLLSRMIV